MINPILNHVFIISLSCTAIAALLLAVRMIIGKNTGAWWRSTIWVLLLIRLCIPVLIESPIGLINTNADRINTNPVSDIEYNNSVAELPGAYEVDTELAVPSTDNGHSYNNNPNSFSWISLLNDVYFFGAIIAFLVLLFRIAILNYKVSKLEKCTDKDVLNIFNGIKKWLGIRRNITLVIEDRDSAPALCGLIVPVVIIPKSTLEKSNASELEYIFIHELTHYKRRDIAKLWLLELVCCIHWFNPILHLIKPTIVQDIELACDERVISKIGRDEYAGYSNVLVSCSTINKSKHPLVVTSNFAGKRGSKLKERLVMIKKYNRRKIMITGLVLVVLLAAVLVACSTAVSKTEAEFKNARVSIAYVNEMVWDIDDVNNDLLMKYLNSEEVQTVSVDSFDMTEKNDFTYVIYANDKQYDMFRLDCIYDMIFVKSSEDEKKMYYYNSSGLGDLLDNIEGDYIKNYEITRYDDMLLDAVCNMIDGTRTIENVVSNTDEWDMDDNNRYSTKMYLYSHISVIYSIHAGEDNLNRALDYSKDILIVDCAEKEREIINPTSEELYNYLFDKVDVTAENQTDNVIPVKDMNLDSTYGQNLIELIMSFTEGDEPIGNLIEEFSMPYIDGAFKLKMVSSTDEYNLSIFADEDVNREFKFNLESMTVVVESVGKWTVENPDVDYLFENMMTPYIKQLPTPESDDIDTEEYPPGIYAVYFNVNRQKTMVDLPLEVFMNAYNLVYIEESEYIDLSQYQDTQDEFFTTDIYLNSNGEFHGERIEILINSKGEYALRFKGNGWRGVLAGNVCDEIIEIVKSETDWNFIGTDAIKDVVQAEISVDGDVIATLTDTGKLEELENMLTNAKCKGYTPKTMMYRPILTLSLENGQQLKMYLDLENDLMMLGSSFHYDYGPGYIDGTSINNLPILMGLFDIDSFGDINPRGDISELDITDAMDVVRNYFTAIENEDVSLLADCVHTNRYDTDKTFFDEFDDIRLTLDTVYDYNINHQTGFDYHLDNDDALLIIVQVDFTVEYLVDNANTPYNDGQYTGWNFILVRERLGSPWKIYDQGY